MPSTTARRKITPPMLAERWGVSSDKIVHFIVTGQLRAIDASLRRGDRPRYLIDEDDITAFEASREVVPQKPVTSHSRRRSLPNGFVRNFR
jgi:hypothetical protein